MNELLIITPKTKVGELLDAYPQLEEKLIELSPAFKKLKSPVLRKTVSKIANLQQAASIGNIGIAELINALRKEVGQEEYFSDNSISINKINTPQWLNDKIIVSTLDVRPIINAGGHPMKDVLDAANNLKKGEILNFITPFIPAPLIDKLKNKGFDTFSKEDEVNVFFNYVFRK